MKMALAKKLKAQRKTCKKTIAEILGDASAKNQNSKFGEGLVSQDEGDEASGLKANESDDNFDNEKKD
tara:strand:- start:239 stop:442 length:204 start_codon:yes stop_codon:yes gene_type:complete